MLKTSCFLDFLRHTDWREILYPSDPDEIECHYWLSSRLTTGLGEDCCLGWMWVEPKFWCTICDSIVYIEERNGTHTSEENQATEKSRGGREPRSSLRSLAWRYSPEAFQQFFLLAAQFLSFLVKIYDNSSHFLKRMKTKNLNRGQRTEIATRLFIVVVIRLCYSRAF